MSELKTTLKVAVDGSAAMAGIEGVKKSFQNLESSSISSAKNVSQGLDNVARSSSQSASTLTANARRVEKSLENQANRLSMTSAEYARHRAIAAGVSKDVYEPLVARIDAASRSTANLGMSAKATSAAMRNVPAQLTDIVVGLQGGQAPLTVLLQQGGQLKDMFGGVVPAFKALATTAIGMVSPLTLAAGAVIGLGAAYYSGAQESVRFGKAIIESGNYAGQTAASLGTLSAKVADATGSTVSNAAAVTASVVATGQLASSSLEMVATAAIQLEKNGGQAVEKTVEAFVSLGKNPAQAALALNETYNFLTLSVYEQIVALQKQGDQQGAVKLAMTTYADTVAARSKDVQENLGYIERAWRAVKGATVGAIDAAKGLGRDDTAQETLTGLEREARAREENVRLARAAGATVGQRELDAVATARSAVTAFKDQLTVRENIARAAGVSAEKEKERLAAGVKWAALEEQNLSKLKQREKAEKDIRDLGAKLRLDDAKIQAQVDASNERLKDPKVAAPKAYRDDAATKVLQQLKEQEASLRAQADGETKISDAAKERAKFEQQIADIKEKKVLTAEQKSLLASQDAIRAQYDKNVAISDEVKQREALIKMDERSAQIQASIASSQASRQEQYERTLSAYGLGDRAQRRVLSETGIRREFQRNQDQLNKATPESLLGSEKYLSESRKIADGQAAALDAQRQFYAEEDRLRGSWQLGFQNAFQNYADVASDAYRSSASVFGTVFGGMEDRLTTFISKGKVDFAGFADSIISDLARIYARQAISGLAGLIGQAFAPAAASTATGYSPGSSGFIPTLDVSGGRAIGGPVSAGKVYQVNESGEPELANVGGKQYLLMGNQPGAVTPMKALTGSSAQTTLQKVEFNLINQSGQQLQATPGPMRIDAERMIVDVFVKDVRTNGPMSTAMMGRMR